VAVRPAARDAPLRRLTDEFAARARRVLDAPTFGKWKPELARRVGPNSPAAPARTAALSWPASAATAACCPRPWLSTAVAAPTPEPRWPATLAPVRTTTPARRHHHLDLYRPLVRVTTVAELLEETRR
jgi:hypothetical protein